MKKCYICNKDLENAETYYFDCEKYTCNNCYELYHKPKYNEIQRNELINHYQKLQNQKAIECLKDLRQNILIDNCKDYSVDLKYLIESIDTTIKELEGKDDNNI